MQLSVVTTALSCLVSPEHLTLQPGSEQQQQGQALESCCSPPRPTPACPLSDEKTRGYFF